MEIGSKVKFDYVDQFGKAKSTTLVLSSVYNNRMKDEEVYSRLDKTLQDLSLSILVDDGYILAARCLLSRDPNARNIFMFKIKEDEVSSNDDAAAKRMIAMILLPFLL